jgi:DNA helicase-2/ATP-dependent DNA helicase PcrA
MFQPRPKQQEILAYRGGKMGISAVPGSGKTQILSRLAAEIIAGDYLQDDQEVLVVTLVNSAVDNFSARVSTFLKELDLLPYVGYRVRTLHGLAHDIVRARPDLAGLADDFQIIDERAADQIREDAALAWLRANPFALEEYLDAELDASKADWVRRELLPQLAGNLALSFIRSAKDRRLTPEILKERLGDLPLPLARMGCAIYADYQRALAYRGAVDFDDLIRLALSCLEQDPAYLERLRLAWPYILEDEAQDSSNLQEEILRLLAGAQGNWVRVGDPNQAIFETFTTASPEHLRRFLADPDVMPRAMPNSGRSTQGIIDLANRLIVWSQKAHPQEAVRGALAEPLIEPAPPGDPQPNPTDDPDAIQLFQRKLTPLEEIQAVAISLSRWLPEHPEETVAVLVPRNQRGFELVDELRRRNLPYTDTLLRSTTATRGAAALLRDVVDYLADPGSPKKLVAAYRAWRRAKLDGNDPGASAADDGVEAASGGDEAGRPEPVPVERIAGVLRDCRQVEAYLWPRAGRDWLAELEGVPDAAWAVDELAEFREILRRWQGAAILPVDQLVLSLAQDLFKEPGELAIAHKLAFLLRQAAETHADWRLPQFTGELAVIAQNERRFLGFSDDDTGFTPELHKGEAIVATMHKSKGLEFDRVYLMSVNNYDFPSGMEYDRYISEPWYLRDDLNLEAEALEQLDAVLSTDPYEWYTEGTASLRARLEYVAERLRLLYVGITRARKSLVVTWNSGRDGNLAAALPLAELIGFSEKEKNR